jgi:hypothetical protein
MSIREVGRDGLSVLKLRLVSQRHVRGETAMRGHGGASA